jgi:hypothetical protein
MVIARRSAPTHDTGSCCHRRLSRQRFSFNGIRGILPVGGLAVLIASALCSIVAGGVWSYEAPKIPSLRQMVDEKWDDSDEEARRATTSANIKVLTTLQSHTDTQVNWLISAGALQILAVIALGITTWLAATGSPQSEVQQARNAMKDEPEVSKLLDALNAEGLLKSRDDVLELTTYFRASCEFPRDGAQEIPDTLRTELAKDLHINITEPQAQALEPVRAELCAAQ